MNKILINLEVAESCTPVTLSLTCDETTSFNYSLHLGTEPIRFKRRGLQASDKIVLTVTNPTYLGCNKLEFMSPYIKSGSPAEWKDIKTTFSDILADGTVSSVDTVDLLWDIEATASRYAYTLCFTPANNDTYHAFCELQTSDFEFVFTDPLQLTVDGGYPFSSTFGDECAVTPGKLTMCGKRLPVFRTRHDANITLIDVVNARAGTFTNVPDNVIQNSDFDGRTATFSDVRIEVDNDASTFLSLDPTTGQVSSSDDSIVYCAGHVISLDYTLVDLKCSTNKTTSTVKLNVVNNIPVVAVPVTVTGVLVAATVATTDVELSPDVHGLSTFGGSSQITLGGLLGEMTVTKLSGSPELELNESTGQVTVKMGTYVIGTEFQFVFRLSETLCPENYSDSTYSVIVEEAAPL